MGRILLCRPLKQDLYHLPTTPSTPPSPHALTTSIQPVSTWHHKLGHPAMKIIKHLTDNHHIPIKLPPSAKCSSCQYAKSHKHPFSNHSLTSNRPLELLYTYVWGPAPFSSRHINFIENSFPYSSRTHPHLPSTSTTPLATTPHTLIPTTITTKLPTDSPPTQPPLLDPPHTATTPDIAGVSDPFSSPSSEDSSGNNTSTPPPTFSYL
ncbi:hypothetical protein L6164_016767 [Bauhinia variegata]|uniref:Uncharacterized protein n=1 Tax=Bauhinia variegata TaxID=167791 RepID=A0ACB9N5F7_BAUVA|nr:hypothetical protein L6164_016767 [Bauhinia variegata]